MFKLGQSFQGFMVNLKQSFMGSAVTVEDDSLGYDDPLENLELEKKQVVSVSVPAQPVSGERVKIKPQFIQGVSQVVEIKPNDEKIIGEAPYLDALGRAAIANAENIHKPVNGRFPSVETRELFI